ncbi:hypothetical protein PO124_05855 [Bacillus licheniformis]|nr:hypothetical protein [Bacillus licheniformis]
MKFVFEEASRIWNLKIARQRGTMFFPSAAGRKQHVLNACRCAGRKKTEADAIIGYLLKRAKSQESPPRTLPFISQHQGA